MTAARDQDSPPEVQDLPASLEDFRRKAVRDALLAYACLAGRGRGNFSAVRVAPVLAGGRPMSAATGNIVSPQPLIARHGEDALRMGMLFTAPPAQAFEWSDQCVISADRWLQRFRDRWKVTGMSGAVDADALSVQEADERRLMHSWIGRVAGEYAAFRTDRAIAGVMTMLAEVQGGACATAAVNEPEALRLALAMLAPVVPGLVRECLPGNCNERNKLCWPKADPAALAAGHVTLAIQVNGRLRGQLRLLPGLGQAQAQEEAARVENVRRHLAGKRLDKVIYLPDRLINLVVR